MILLTSFWWFFFQNFSYTPFHWTWFFKLINLQTNFREKFVIFLQDRCVWLESNFADLIFPYKISRIKELPGGLAPPPTPTPTMQGFVPAGSLKMAPDLLSSSWIHPCSVYWKRYRFLRGKRCYTRTNSPYLLNLHEQIPASLLITRLKVVGQWFSHKIYLEFNGWVIKFYADNN